MAQGSMMWDDGGGGDAVAGSTQWDSPYSSAEWRNRRSVEVNSDAATGLVIPDLDNMLVVEESAVPAMTVEVGTGYLFSRGALYINTAQQAVAIAASDPVNPRIDRVVATLTVASQTVRLAVVTGVAAAAPTLPALTTTAAVWMVDIAHVYVRGNTLTILDEDISDKREFYNNGHQAPQLLATNLLSNSEFMAYSALSIADPTVYPPDYWQLEGSPSAMTRNTFADQMSRGGALEITADAATEGVYQTVKVKPDTWYAVKGCVQVTAGDVGRIVVTTDSAAPATLTRDIRRTGTWLTEWMFYETESDASELTLQLLCLNNGDIVEFGQFLIVEGMDAGPFREIRESLPFEWSELRDTSYDGNAIGIATHTLDLDVNYGGLVLEGTKAIDFQVYNTTAEGGPYPTVSVQNVSTGRVLAYTWLAIGGHLFVRIATDVNRQWNVVVAVNAIDTGWFIITGIEV